MDEYYLPFSVDITVVEQIDEQVMNISVLYVTSCHNSCPNLLKTTLILFVVDKRRRLPVEYYISV